MEYWKISDFAKEVGKHQNTVDGWFKQLEEKNVHWVNRSEHGEKIYSTLDMKMAKYIKEMRDQKSVWMPSSMNCPIVLNYDLFQRKPQVIHKY